jgi:hypothetical protein
MAAGGSTFQEKRKKYITIDGMGTIEIDYSELHPRLLYLRAGIKAP